MLAISNEIALCKVYYNICVVNQVHIRWLGSIIIVKKIDNLMLKCNFVIIYLRAILLTI